MGKRIKCTDCGRTIRLREPGKCPYCGKEFSKADIDALPDADIDLSTVLEENREKPQGFSALLINPYFLVTIGFLIVGFFMLKLIKSCSNSPTQVKKMISKGKVDIFDKLTGNDVAARKQQLQAYKLKLELKVKQDLIQIQKLLEMHHAKYGNYPYKLSGDLEELSSLGAVKELLKRFEGRKILSYRRFMSPDKKTEQYFLQVKMKKIGKILSISGKFEKEPRNSKEPKDTTTKDSKKDTTSLKKLKKDKKTDTKEAKEDTSKSSKDEEKNRKLEKKDKLQPGKKKKTKPKKKSKIKP